jgi:TonB family protein
MTNTIAVVFKRSIARSCRRARTALLLALAMVCLGVTLRSQAQDAPARKVITRVEPKYPATLERLYIGGVVKLEVVVAANGSVESAALIGGNPILGQAAIAAVKQWKYAAGPAKTTVTERLEFDPHH